MKLIVDAGSTKAHWQIRNRQNEVQQVYTDGINLLTHSWEYVEAQISCAISQAFSDEAIESLEIYAAGGINEAYRDEFKRKMSERFSLPENAIEIESDLYLAAKSLCGTEPGIACILGTGSNSCFWDGSRIVKNVRPLGYILGDEGSGATLGKKLVANWFKGLLSPMTQRQLENFISLSYSEVMSKIYKEPGANKFLASLTKFMSANIGNDDIQLILHQSFTEFVERNLLQYEGVHDFPINFVGSIAYFFHAQLENVLNENGLRIGNVKREPFE